MRRKLLGLKANVTLYSFAVFKGLPLRIRTVWCYKRLHSFYLWCSPSWAHNYVSCKTEHSPPDCHRSYGMDRRFSIIGNGVVTHQVKCFFGHGLTFSESSSKHHNCLWQMSNRHPSPTKEAQPTHSLVSTNCQRKAIIHVLEVHVSRILP